MKLVSLFTIAFSTVWLFGCASVRDTAGIPRAEVLVREADAAWLRAVKDKDLDATVSFYAKDAVTAGPVMFSAHGPAEFRQEWAKVFADPKFDLAWTMQSVRQISPDLACTSGRWSSAGKQGEYLAVWQRQSDGRWMILIDGAWF
ncbi:hypothetical protein DB347_22635 [Opitutaceae bacterium EW11]|nr:hypothetical protein DB347_22635 [Opitutaceae bacterium EW11]